MRRLCRCLWLMNSLVRPKKAIPDDAISIHGITNEAVAGAPSWAALYGEFYRLIENKVVVIYNEDFDVRLLAQTAILPVHSAFLIQTFCIPLILLNNSPNQITQALRIPVNLNSDSGICEHHFRKVCGQGFCEQKLSFEGRHLFDSPNKPAAKRSAAVVDPGHWSMTVHLTSEFVL